MIIKIVFPNKRENTIYHYLASINICSLKNLESLIEYSSLYWISQDTIYFL